MVDLVVMGPAAWIRAEEGWYIQPVTEWLDYAIRALKWLLPVGLGAYLLRKLEQWWHVRRMREHIYGEMAENYEKLANRRRAVTSMEGIKRLSTERFLKDLNLRVTTYEHYRPEDGGPIFDLKEVSAIDAIYSHYKAMAFMAQNEFGDGFEANREAMKALAEVDRYVRLGKLNMKVLKKVSHPKIYDFLAKVKAGEVESHEKDLDPIP